MNRNFGPPIKELNGYTIRKIFIQKEDGTYIHIGYGIFSPEGELAKEFSGLYETLEHLQQIEAQPPSPDW
ncbi:hypothetical protein [Frateuria defendens]|uniref:hypothetical protein n=1 Tax=Frateuria defendens TaxID=2219559 RepID=UPI000B1B122F|nr:hypothetical protein [Frateuria defendens]